ncbi:hypothetical protein QYM36_007660, partial [Artemia franciscana]
VISWVGSFNFPFNQIYFFQIKLDDPLPKRICKACELRIDQWSQFFQSCHALFEELQARLVQAQLIDRSQIDWTADRLKEEWNGTSQTERWDTMVSIVPIKKSSLSSHRKDFLDQEPSPSSDCYTGINGLLKAAEVTSLEENRPMEDVIEHGRKSRLDAQPSNNSYSNFYSYSSINESFTEDETIDNASPLGPINLTGSHYEEEQVHQWRHKAENSQLNSPDSEGKISVVTSKTNMTAEELVNLLSNRNLLPKGHLTQALMSQHIGVSSGQILQELDQKQFNSTRNNAVEPAMLCDTECPGSFSNSEEGSAEDWGSTGNSVGHSEQDARYVPVLATTGNPPETQDQEPDQPRVSIPVTVEQMQNPRILSQKELTELSSLFERGDKQGILAFIVKATKQTVRLWRCTRCSASIEGLMKHLEDHYVMIHNVEPQYECDLCDTVLLNSHQYSRHWASHIPIKRCDICNKVAGNLYSVSCGEGNQRRVVCETCGRRYIMPTMEPLTSSLSPSLVRSSKRSNSGSEDGKFACNVCGKRLKSKQTLNTHMLLHKEDTASECPDCSRVFSTKAELKSHRSLEHEKDKRFVCPVSECQKRFKTRVALKGHETLHTGEKPYKCPICPKEIRAQSNFYTHLKVHRKRGEEIPPSMSHFGGGGGIRKSSPEATYQHKAPDIVIQKRLENFSTDGRIELSPGSEFTESPAASDLSLRTNQVSHSPWTYDLEQ